MASIELSLDDIIRKKRIPPARRGRGGIRQAGVTRQQFKPIVSPINKNAVASKRGGFINSRGRPPILGDARNNIILKNRTKITDARDKLAEMAKQKDARYKLEQLRMSRGGNNIHNRNIIGNMIPKNRNPGLKTKPRYNRGFTDLTREVHSSPLIPSHPSRNMPMNTPMPISGYDMDISMEEEYVPVPLKKIVRSINNDSAHYLPPPPNFSLMARTRSQKPLRDKTVLSNRQSGFNLTIVAKNNDIRKPTSTGAGILKRSYRQEEPLYVRDRSPGEPVSILKKRPSASLRNRLENPSHSPPYKTTRRASPPRPPSPPKPPGYRIVVSNLQNSVTASDIHELFGDIGDLLESRLVRPGTAEVIYNTLKDAQKAVDVYHNRQLDGQPMNCFLVNPRNPPTGTRQNTTSKTSSSRGTSASTLPASSNSSVVPDVSTFYKVLFGKDQY